MILAGDIGGTKTNLALYEWTAERVDPVRLESLHSKDYTSLEDILVEFLTPPKPPASSHSPETEEKGKSEKAEQLPSETVKLTAACFGIAGPVKHSRSLLTNLRWTIDAQREVIVVSHHWQLLIIKTVKQWNLSH